MILFGIWVWAIATEHYLVAIGLLISFICNYKSNAPGQPN